VFLIDRDKFRAETQADDGDVCFAVGHELLRRGLEDIGALGGF